MCNIHYDFFDEQGDSLTSLFTNVEQIEKHQFLLLIFFNVIFNINTL